MSTKAQARARSPKATRAFVWRKLSAAKWEDAWIERLASVADRLAITALAGRKFIRIEAFQLTRPTADALARHFGGTVAAHPKKFPISTQVARSPIRIRDQLIVVASEQEYARFSSQHRPVIYIPAGMAFGTGDHATTSTCLRLLADLGRRRPRNGWEMLDLGTGSGILGIAARVFGAHRVTATDFDPHAIRTAKANARLNGVTRMKVQKLDVLHWNASRTWDVIVANLFSGVLTQAAAHVSRAASASTSLILSRILREQAANVLAAYGTCGWYAVKVIRVGKWVSTLLERSSPTLSVGANEIIAD